MFFARAMGEILPILGTNNDRVLELLEARIKELTEAKTLGYQPQGVHELCAFIRSFGEDILLMREKIVGYTEEDCETAASVVASQRFVKDVGFDCGQTLKEIAQSDHNLSSGAWKILNPQMERAEQLLKLAEKLF